MGDKAENLLPGERPPDVEIHVNVDDVAEKFSAEGDPPSAVSDLQYIINNAYAYKDCSYFTYGTYYNWQHKILVGFLTPKFGILHFSDSQKSIPIVITNFLEVKDYLDCKIMIKDFVVISEVYIKLGSTFHAMQYLLVDSKQISKLENLEKRQLSPHHENTENIKMVIISKSLPTASTKYIAFWLEVKTETNKHYFIKLTTFSQYPSLVPGHHYVMHHSKNYRQIFDKELSVVNRTIDKIQFEAEPTFSALGQITKPKILTADEAACAHGLISFEAKIILKKFNKPIGSRSCPATKSALFGTPGAQTHILNFETGRNSTVFLNNWENLHVPYGLIPGMRVIVRNVLKQSNYFKSTAMTSFEIVRYEPRVKFECANLCHEKWGVPFDLGAGRFFSDNVLVYGRVFHFKILRLHVSVAEGRLSARIALITTDDYGQSKIIAKDKAAISLLKVLLDKNDFEFKEWCKRFVALDMLYEYPNTFTNTSPHSQFRDLLNEYFQLVESVDQVLDLLCRKMDNEDDGKPVYIVLDSRHS